MASLKSVKENCKYLFCDLDGTLIQTLSLNTFPKGIWDMQFKFDVLDKIKEIQPEWIFIVTNQGGIPQYQTSEDFETKCTYIAKCIEQYCGIPVNYTYCASMDKNDPYRKPNTGMLDVMCSAHKISQSVDSKKNMVMIGDASGTPGQFSDSDKKCAIKFGITYFDVDDFIKLV